MDQCNRFKKNQFQFLKSEQTSIKDFPAPPSLYWKNVCKEFDVTRPEKEVVFGVSELFDSPMYIVSTWMSYLVTVIETNWSQLPDIFNTLPWVGSTAWHFKMVHSSSRDFNGLCIAF